MGGNPGLEEKWRQQAEALKREVQKLPKGREREEVLRKAQIKFDTPAVLAKWPSSNDEHLDGETPYLVAEGTLGECIALFTSKPMTELPLYEIRTAPQGELITAVLSARQIIELAGLWGFVYMAGQVATGRHRAVVGLPDRRRQHSHHRNDDAGDPGSSPLRVAVRLT